MEIDLSIARKRKIVLVAALAAIIAFWIVANTIDVYALAITGAIFEILWLPVITAGFAIPVISIIYWYREKLKVSSFFFYLAILSIIMNVSLLIG